MWENIVERGTAQMAVWRMRIACWIPKATNTHTEHVILIACPQQQWLHERTSMLRYTYSTLPVLQYVSVIPVCRRSCLHILWAPNCSHTFLSITMIILTQYCSKKKHETLQVSCFVVFSYCCALYCDGSFVCLFVYCTVTVCLFVCLYTVL